MLTLVAVDALRPDTATTAIRCGQIFRRKNSRCKENVVVLVAGQPHPGGGKQVPVTTVRR